MKKLFFALVAVVVMCFSVTSYECFAVESENVLKISKTGDMWNDYTNMMNIVFPGGTISGLYYNKLYAEYDGYIGGFVVKEKVPSHCSYTKKVGEAAFGLCFSYNPEYNDGNKFGKDNYKTWSKIRVGDVLYPHGIDFTAKTIKTEGKLSEKSFKTNSYFTVSFTNRSSEPTAYSDKKIVALGDSVTCNGGWTETVGDMLGCEIVNSGVSADRVTEALVRFERDVAAHSPDIVLVMFGINDCVQYHYSDKTVYAFKNELYELHKKCKDLGAETIFITPNNIKVDKLNFDRYKDYGGLSECYPKFIEMVKTVARETSSHLIDIYSSFDKTENLLCDTVHPNKEGYEIISSVIGNYMILFADVICGDSVEGYVSTGMGEFEIDDETIYLTKCTVKELKKYFCNDIRVYRGEEIVPWEEEIKDGYTVFWIDKNGSCRDCLTISLR